MKEGLKEEFLEKWEKYFGDSELPITFYYTADIEKTEIAPSRKEWSCVVCDLTKVRKGNNLSFNIDSLGCGGSKRYLGYTNNMRPKFEYFLSCGIPDKMEGERYIKTPEMVKEIMKKQVTLPIDEKSIVFKRWDKLTDQDNPEVAIFFAKPDVLSGLFTLANFDQTEPNGTFTPFAPGCGSIVHFPYLEINSERPRAVIGLFDPSARPCVSKNTLSFAVPMVKFEKMISYMDESFLITETWKTMLKRINN